jgi:RNA polymerase sigma-32 factor
MAEVAGVQRSFIRAAMNAPFLERDEERALAVRWRNDRDEVALHRLASAHMRLVIALAARFRHYGLPMADLVQEGHIGLLEAAARFEPDREVRFSTYATWWIRASIQDFILRNWSIVRGGTSSAQKALFFNLRRLRARLTRNGDERVSDKVHQHIATTLGVSKADVATMDARLSGPDVVGDGIDSERRTKWLRAALAVLSEREMRILQERRLSDEQATLESLGAVLGISKERVRQIENRAIEKLKRALLDRHPRPEGALV